MLVRKHHIPHKMICSARPTAFARGCPNARLGDGERRLAVGSQLRARPARQMKVSFKPEDAPPEAPASVSPAPVNGSVVQQYIEQHHWAAEIMALHQEVHQAVQASVEPLLLQPTKYAPNGVLQVPSLDGKSEFQVTTHAGEGSISHKYTSFGAVPGFGLLYTKTGVHACMEQGTPFLDFELVGTEQSLLIAWTLTPRLGTLRHPDYTRKYYRSTPPGARPGVVPFTELHGRLQALTKPQTGPAGSAKPLLQHFNSPQMWTRLMAGHAAMFTLDPLDAVAMAAVREHAKDLLELWCALVAADWAAAQSGEVLKGEMLVQECRDMSRNMACFLEADEDTARFAKMIGSEGMTKLKATVSGAAAVGRQPWWCQ